MPMQNRYGSDEEMYSDTESSPASQSEGLLPKSILGGGDFKPGDTITLEITGVQDDSVRVKVASSAPEAEDEAEEMAESESPELAGPAPTESEMSAMMS